MKKSRMIMAALGVAVIIGVPILGASVAPARESVAAHSLRHTEGGLGIVWLAPLANRTEFYGGAVIPVRIMLLDEDATAIEKANVTVWVNDLPASSPGAVNAANMMKNLHGSLYIFNLDTKPYQAGPGSPPIALKVLAKAPDDRNFFDTLMLTLD